MCQIKNDDMDLIRNFWEYRTYDWNTNEPGFDLTKKLNRYGAFGWELITSQFYGSDMIFIKVVFKRIKTFYKIKDSIK